MDDREKLLKNIEAMLNDSGRTPAEAEATRRMAEKLLARHGMSLEDLQRDAKMDHLKIEANLFADIVLRRCAVPIERLTRTKCWISPNYSKKSGRVTNGKCYHFAGYGPDVEWAEWLAQTLVKEAHRQALLKFGDYRQRNDFAAAFGSVAGRRIEALADQMEEQVLATVTENALVPEDFMSPIYAWMKEVLGMDVSQFVDSKSRGRGYTSADAVIAGRAAGERAALGRPVGQGSGSLRIGNG